MVVEGFRSCMVVVSFVKNHGFMVLKKLVLWQAFRLCLNQQQPSRPWNAFNDSNSDKMSPCRSSRSSQQKKGKGKAKDSTSLASWSDSDIDFLVEQVITHWSEGSKGLGFKKSFWQSISESFSLAKPEKGGPKTRTGCKEK